MKITAANSAGMTSTSYALPQYFDIKGYDKRECQIVIYSELIGIYKERGFKVGISIEHDVAELILSWNIGLNEDERRKREKIISKHSVLRGD
jgi:hypothetical protein